MGVPDSCYPYAGSGGGEAADPVARAPIVRRAAVDTVPESASVLL